MCAENSKQKLINRISFIVPCPSRAVGASALDLSTIVV